MPWPTADPNKSLALDSESVPSGHLTDTAPHAAATNLEKTANKGAASGYAALGTDSKVPTAQLGGTGAGITKYLRGDQTWQVPSGGAGVAKESHVTFIAVAVEVAF